MGRALFRYRVAVIAAFFAAAVLAAYGYAKHPELVPASASSLAASFTELTSHELAFAVCGALSVLAFLIRAAGEARLGSVVYGQDAGTRVVSSGPFRFSRNPLYLGVLLFFVATVGPYLAPLLIAALTVGLTLTLRSIAIYEEGTLVTALGAPYQRYLAIVPRFLGLRRANDSAAAVDDDGIRVTGRAWLYAIAGNLGLFTLGLYRLLDAAGVSFRGMKLLNVTLFALWIAIVLVRRVLAK